LSEKYLKRLIGKTEIEDALKRLDKLTSEEVRMVTAQVLKATRTVDERVAHVDEGVTSVDDRVARVDEGVTRVDGRVAGIEGRVASVDDKVKAIDDKVAVGIDGAQPSLITHQESMSDPDVIRGKRDKGTHTTGRR
jgi:prophage DNA circulation protein